MSDPTQTNLSTQHTLPSSPFGISSTRYADVDNPLVPLPQRNVMSAANRLNDYRYRKLSEKQRAFIDVYLASGFNAAESAKRCGFCIDVPQDDRYEKVCASIGRRLVKSQHIAMGIQLALDYHAERNKINVDDLLMELRHIAFSNMGNYYVNDGVNDPHLQMPEDGETGKLAAISELTVESYVEGRGESSREVKRIKFKLHDKLAAIEKLLKIAAAKGDPAVAGMNDADKPTGPPTVNVFNIMPVPSGEFIPAPQPQHALAAPQQPAPVVPQLAPPVHHNIMPVTITPPNVAQAPMQWAQPERAQKRSLTIENEP